MFMQCLSVTNMSSYGKNSSTNICDTLYCEKLLFANADSNKRMSI